MTRINRPDNTGPQSIPSQDEGGSRQISKPESQRNQEPSAAEQQQIKQAAQGRKSDIDLQGTIKQSELAQFHGPGGGLVGGPLGGVGEGQGNQGDVIIPDAVSGVGKILDSERRDSLILERQTKKLNFELSLGLLVKGDIKEARRVPGDKDDWEKEKVAQTIVDTYFPKKESNSSKKTE